MISVIGPSPSSSPFWPFRTHTALRSQYSNLGEMYGFQPRIHSYPYSQFTRSRAIPARASLAFTWTWISRVVIGHPFGGKPRAPSDTMRSWSRGSVRWRQFSKEGMIRRVLCSGRLGQELRRPSKGHGSRRAECGPESAAQWASA